MSTTKTARAVALETLMRVFNDGSYSNLSLNNSLQDSDLSQIDRNFATRLVYGTIQYKIYLEYQFKDLIKTRLKEKYLEPLLLMSGYQIIFLDKVPNRAVLSEANILAKQFGRHHSTGFKIVNGILHALIRRGPVLPPKSNWTEYLSIKESTPVWLVDYLIENWEQERAEAILASINLPAKNSIRLSSLFDRDETLAQLRKAGFAPAVSTFAPDSVILDRGGISHSELFKSGKVTIQDEAASLAVASFDFTGDEQVLDACSAPGGKTVQIAERLIQGQVLALDIHANKLNLVKQSAKRMGVSSRVKTKQLDARDADVALSGQKFAKILIDAPCSGLGLLRRKPEIRYTKQRQDLLDLQQIQLALLDHVSKLLQENGELIYSTCSFAVEEDEQVIEAFLAAHSKFALVPIDLGKITAPTGMLKILPDTYGSDGFFIAKLILRG